MKAIVSLSGGLDSTVLLGYAAHQWDANSILACSFNYGQRHVKELSAAAAVAAFYDVEHIVFDLRPVTAFWGSDSSLLFGSEVPHGHYAEDTMKQTIVPNRNMIFASIATGLAVSRGADTICLAVHGGDHFVYPDCRPEFMSAMSEAIRLGNPDANLELYAPFIWKTKADIARIGESLNVPMALSWSCYEGGDLHCGRCGTCVERIEAFRIAGVPDPTEYDPEGLKFALDVLQAKAKETPK